MTFATNKLPKLLLRQICSKDVHYVCLCCVWCVCVCVCLCVFNKQKSENHKKFPKTKKNTHTHRHNCITKPKKICLIAWSPLLPHWNLWTLDNGKFFIKKWMPVSLQTNSCKSKCSILDSLIAFANISHCWGVHSSIANRNVSMWGFPILFYFCVSLLREICFYFYFSQTHLLDAKKKQKSWDILFCILFC